MSLDPVTAGLDLLGTLARIVEAAQRGETTPEEAIAAARKALGVDPLAGLAAEDAARHARLLAVEHEARTERSDEPTLELPLPHTETPRR